MPNEQILHLVSELATRYQLTSIRPLLEICAKADAREGLNVAVLGRFKAGKSSFVNDLIGREALPVGVIPVTAVVTEVVYGPDDGASVRFLDGRQIEVPLQQIRQYVAEAENPLNRKGVASVEARVSTLGRWRDLRFIDTPGLESAFAHNSEASLGWAPNVDIALVAIGVDPPLSERDIELIRTLLTYTPRIAILLTKADVLDPAQLHEVVDFVRSQLEARFEQEIPIYPYSTRRGFENLKREVEEKLLYRISLDVASERRAISDRKFATLINDCRQYMSLSLKTAEMLDTERFDLQKQLSAERKSLDDTRLELKLIARHSAGGTRSTIEKALAPSEKPIRAKLLQAFEEYSNQLPDSLAGAIDAFSDWLRAAMASELTALSAAGRSRFAEPLADAQRQYQRVLQNFRNRLSDRTLALYGMPLKTTEPAIDPEPPKAPDIHIGRVFDHNWELLSPLLPMGLLRRAVFNRFRRKIADETFKNLSRMTGQWEEIVTSSIFALLREAERRLEELLTTVEGLVSVSGENAPQIGADIERLGALTSVAAKGEKVEQHL